jgi:protein phosphatase 2C family protein 2/3
MEDEHICIDDIAGYLDNPRLESMAFYGVFDGHGGSEAVTYVKENLLDFILQDDDFPDGGLEKAIRNAFMKADGALAEADMSSGTTALVAMVSGKSLVVANAGDCRAVLGKRGGRVLQMSTDHKPTTSAERSRIESRGGFVDEVGYLNGELEVSRALGDWHLKACMSIPLCAEPDVQEVELSEEDEFLIVACDGLWDVVSSESAVGIARRELMSSNDPDRCCRVLVTEALRRHSADNITVVVVCFSARPPQRNLFGNSRLGSSANTASFN